MKNRKNLGYLLIPALIPFITQAADSLNEVIVWGKTPSLTVPDTETWRAELNQIPGGVDVIDSEVYKRGRSVTLKDVLDYSPGVFVQPRFGAEEARISIRGSGIQRTFHGRGLKLMQDSVPVNTADGGFDFQAIEPLVARTVNVYRGANALQFGSTTLGGAIDFISPTGFDAAPLELRAEAGSFGTARGLLSTGGVIGANDYFLSLSHFSQDGYREHSRQSNQRLFANVGHRFNPELETRFYLTLARTDSELPGNLTKDQLESRARNAQRNPNPFLRVLDYVDSNWKRDFELLRIANKTTWQSDQHKLTLNAFWSRKDLHHPILFVIDQFTNDYGVGARYENSGELAGHKNRFTLGFNPTWGFGEDNRYDNVRGKSGTRRASMDQSATNLDLFAENQFWIAQKFAFSAGSQLSYARRRNRNAQIGANTGYEDVQSWWGFSPKLGVLWDFAPKAQLFANLSQSFEPPSFGELVVTSGFPVLQKTGSVKLDAQKATTAEIGSRGSSGGFRWDAAYYYAWVENELLQFGNPGQTVTVNAGKTSHQGVELGLGFDFLHASEVPDLKDKPTPKNRDSLVLQTNYLWSIFRYNGDPTYGDGPIAGIPEHYLRADFTYTHASGFYIGPNIECVPKGYRVDAKGTLFTDPYFLLGARVGYRAARGWSAYLEARNLTDKRYAATTGVVSDATGSPAQFLPGDGRSIYFGIQYRW